MQRPSARGQLGVGDLLKLVLVLVVALIVLQIVAQVLHFLAWIITSLGALLIVAVIVFGFLRYRGRI